MGTLLVRNSSFTNGKKNHIAATQTLVRIESTTIYDSQDKLETGHGLTCLNCVELTVLNSTFRNLVSYSAPAIYIAQQTGVESRIEDCTFEGNLALGDAGSIRLSNAGVVQLTRNSFIDNSVSDDTDPITDWRFCDAGAVYYSCSLGDCDVVLDGNLFQGNSAKNKGGALRYIHKNFTTVYNSGGEATSETAGRRVLSDRALQQSSYSDTNVYRDNEAAYAPDLASYAASYKFILRQNGNEFESEKGEQVIFAPGQDIQLTVEIYDLEGRLFRDENQAICNIEFVGGQDLPSGSTIINPEEVAENGVIQFDTLNIRQTPDTDTYMQFIFTGLELYGNTVESFEQPAPVKVHARSCD